MAFIGKIEFNINYLINLGLTNFFLLEINNLKIKCLIHIIQVVLD